MLESKADPPTFRIWDWIFFRTESLNCGNRALIKKFFRLQFNVSLEDIARSKLNVTVKNQTGFLSFEKTLMGEVVIDMAELDLAQPTTKWYVSCVCFVFFLVLVKFVLCPLSSLICVCKILRKLCFFSIP